MKKPNHRNEDLYFVCCSRAADLSEQLRSTEDKGRAEREALLERLHDLTTDGTAAKLDNHSLKVTHSKLHWT